MRSTSVTSENMYDRSGISDYRDLLTHLKAALAHIRSGKCEEADAQLRFAKGIVNVSEYLEPTAKVFMTAVFAEFHAAISSRQHRDGQEEDAADVMLENYLQSMQFSHGSNHIVMSDCCARISAFKAVKGLYDDAIEHGGRSLAGRISNLGLLHESTAASHYNMGILYRLQGDYLSSRKELRICRRIYETVHGPTALHVAKVDISLGQTERVSCHLDAAFLHFYLAFHLRVMELGPGHHDTLRAYQLVCQTRYAYKDRLVTSIEIMDRIDELGFYDEDSGSGESDGDVTAVLTLLVNEIFSIRAATHNSGNGVASCAQSSVSSKYITVFGEHIAFRQSHLAGMIRNAVADRIEERRLLRLKSVVNPNEKKYKISVTFDSMSNLVLLTEEILSLILPPVRPNAVKPALGSSISDCGNNHNTIGCQDGGVSLNNLLTPEQLGYLSDRYYKRQGVHIDKGNISGGTLDLVAVTSVELVDGQQNGKRQDEMKPLDAITNTSSTAEMSSIEKSQVTQPARPRKVVPLLKPRIIAPPASKTSNDSQSVGEVESKSIDVKSNNIVSERKSRMQTSAIGSAKKLLQPKASFLRVKEHKDNKAFFTSPLIEKSRRGNNSEVKDVLLPPTGNRSIVISSNAEGKSVTIRPTAPSDVLEALKIKIFTAGIFPYLLLNDFKCIEKEGKEFTATEAVARKRAESATENEPLEALLTTDPILMSSGADDDKNTLHNGKFDDGGRQVCDCSRSNRCIPRPPPLPTSWPPRVENGVNVGGDIANTGGPIIPPASGGMSSLFGALKDGAGALKRKSIVSMKPQGPKRKQLHWDILDNIEGTIWADERDQKNVDQLFAEEEDIFAECADLFAATVQKSAAEKSAANKKADLLKKSQNKHVAVLDGQKSQNINIMLAKFGSRRKVSEIIQAIVSLQSASFTLSTVNTMLEYTPASFADTGEMRRIEETVAKDGIEKLGKAEAYLYELSKIPRVENYLRVLVLLLSIDEIKENILENTSAAIKINEEIRGSVRLKVFFRAALQVGNILNEGTKKGGATAFKISSLSKLSQTKSNSGKTVLQYVATTLDTEMPGILELRKDFESLEAAKHVSFPSLQLDMGKVESGLANLVRLKEDMKKVIGDAADKVESSPQSDSDSEPDDEPEGYPEADLDGHVNTQRKSNANAIISKEVYDNLLEHEKRILELKTVMSEQLHLAQTCHAELCAYLGEDPKSDPETIYGTLISFVNAIGLAAAKRR